MSLYRYKLTVAGLPKKIKNKRFFIPPMYLFLICLSFLSHVRLPPSLFSVPWFSVVRLSGSWSDGFGCGLMGDGRGWWWRWFYGRRLWSDGHESWVRRSNDRGGGSAWVVGRGSPIYWVFVCVMGFGSPI